MHEHEETGGGPFGRVFLLGGILIAAQLSLNLAFGRPEPWLSSRPAAAPVVGHAAPPHAIVLDDLTIAGLSPDGAVGRIGIYQVVSSGADYDRIEFVTDVDTDGVSDRVGYEVKDGTLLRTVRSPAEGEWSETYVNEIVHDVSMFRITFFDGNRSPVSPEALVATQGAGAKWAHVSLAFLDHEREIDAFGGEVELNGLPTVTARAF